jgi:hypothetical protein
MDHIRSGCDWAVVALSGDKQLFDNEFKKISVMKNVKIKMYKFATPRIDLFTQLDPSSAAHKAPLSYNNISYPRAAVLSEIMPLASSGAYKYIWLPHMQADLSHFSFRKFVKSVQCAYFPTLGPLLAQPLVKPKARSDMADSASQSNSNHWPSYMKFDQWKAIEDVYAVRTDFIAMNSAPIFRSDFFQWFVGQLTTPTLKAANFLGSQYMYDNVVCAAARAYGDKLVTSEKRKETAAIIPCAVIINSSPLAFHDSNDPSSPSSSSHTGDFAHDQYLLDDKIKAMTHKAFPTWFVENDVESPNPLYNSTIYRRSFRLNHACLES